MSLLTSHSDANLVIDEALKVTYSMTIIQGSWGYGSLNITGWYSTMRECHRYATKAFRYVGMTYAAAKACKAAMITKFTRTFYTSYWNGNSASGGWVTDSGGKILMADVSMVHVAGDCWEVHVSVNEDDVRFKLVSNAFDEDVDFWFEKASRGYGSDAHGLTDEREDGTNVPAT